MPTADDYGTGLHATMSEFNVRPVSTDDLPLLCTFVKTPRELFFLSPRATYPLTVEQLAEAIASRRASTVIERHGKVVAFANLYEWENGICSIGNVMVAPWARGQGVGKYLIDSMLNIASTAYQATEVRIACFNRNAPALWLYTKMGFESYAIEARLDDAGQKWVLVRMRLTGRALKQWVQRAA